MRKKVSLKFFQNDVYKNENKILFIYKWKYSKAKI